MISVVLTQAPPKVVLTGQIRLSIGEANDTWSPEPCPEFETGAAGGQTITNATTTKARRMKGRVGDQEPTVELVGGARTGKQLKFAPLGIYALITRCGWQV